MRLPKSLFEPPTISAVLEFGCSIIPTGLDKKPLFYLLPKTSNKRRTWRPFQTRRPTSEELELWQRVNPPAFAIVTGAISTRVTFDFDGEKGKALAQDWGIRPHRRTGSGGLHWDIEHPDFYVPTLNGKAQNELRRRWPGLDIKGDGGYAIAFGRSAAGRYNWLRDVRPDPPEFVPAELWKFLRSHGGQHVLSPRVIETVNRSAEDVRVDPNLLIHMALKKVANGNGRNNSGFNLACQLRDNRYSEVEATNVLHQYARLCPSTNTKDQHEAYTSTEILATLRSVFAVPRRNPWGSKTNRRR
jgi:hypothetical protein